MGKSKRNRRKRRKKEKQLESSSAGYHKKKGITPLEVFEEEGMLDDDASKVLEAVYPNPEPLGEDGGEKVIQNREKGVLRAVDSETGKELSPDDAAKVGRRRVELTENLSPVLMAGDTMIEVAGKYIKEGEHARSVMHIERRDGWIGYLLPKVKTFHPNNFASIFVDELVERGISFKRISNS